MGWTREGLGSVLDRDRHQLRSSTQKLVFLSATFSSRLFLSFLFSLRILVALAQLVVNTLS